MRLAIALLIALTSVGAASGSALSASHQLPIRLNCGPFATAGVPAPTPQMDSEAVERMNEIRREANTGPHAILFLGDSLTRKWDPTLWQRYFVPRGALNAGVNGDRTEHLLWRIKHGDLDRQNPRAAVVLIGTNDIGSNRPGNIIAEGIRQILIALRERFPDARILLIGVLPRSELPDSHRRQQVTGVNSLIRTCQDHRHIFYDDSGEGLLNQDRYLSRAVSFDGVHLTQHGYTLLTRRIDRELDSVLNVESQQVVLPVKETFGKSHVNSQNRR